MSSRSRPGVLVVSVDLEPLRETTSLVTPKTTQAIANKLLEQFDDCGISATWAVADALNQPSLNAMLASRPEQEVAIWGGAWTNPTVKRASFNRELASRIDSVETAGKQATTLVCPAGRPLHLDLAQKQGISVLSTRGANIVPSAPQAVKYGLWEVSGQLRIPDHSNWSRWLPSVMPSQQSRIRSRIDEVAGGGVAHLAIEGSRLLRDSGGWRVVDQTLRYANQRRDEGRLSVQSMSSLAQSLSTTPYHAATSILRKAA